MSFIIEIHTATPGEPVTLAFTAPPVKSGLPDSDQREEFNATCTADALAIFDVLRSSIPGGTYDRLRRLFNDTDY